MKPRLLWIMVALPVVTLAQSEPEATMAEAQRLETEYRRLSETPVAKQMREITAKLSALQQEQQTESVAVNEKMNKLRETKEYREYEKQRDELDRQREATGEAARQALAEAARNLYTARHAELRKLTTTEHPEARRLGLNVLSYPRVDGSTSTHPLSVILASHVLGTTYEWIYPEPTGYPWIRRPNIPADLSFSGWDSLAGRTVISRTTDYEFNLATSRTIAKPAQPSQQRVAVMINSLLATSSTTHDAYVKLIEGRCDLNLTARAMSVDESKLASDKGVKIKLEPIARDALVFIVNQNNPVKSITREQIQRIYAEEIKKWDELGGEPKEIRALWRERNSGSRELFDALVTKDQPPIQEPKNRQTTMFSDSMAGPFNRVTQDVQSLGYSIYYYEHFMALSPYTRMVAIDDIEPTPATIRSGKYPYVAEVYAAYRADEPPQSPAMKLLAWLISPEGQAVVRESGYVPVK